MTLQLVTSKKPLTIHSQRFGTQKTLKNTTLATTLGLIFPLGGQAVDQQDTTPTKQQPTPHVAKVQPAKKISLKDVEKLETIWLGYEIKDTHNKALIYRQIAEIFKKDLDPKTQNPELLTKRPLSVAAKNYTHMYLKEFDRLSKAAQLLDQTKVTPEHLIQNKPLQFNQVRALRHFILFKVALESWLTNIDKWQGNGQLKEKIKALPNQSFVEKNRLAYKAQFTKAQHAFLRGVLALQKQGIQFQSRWGASVDRIVKKRLPLLPTPVMTTQQLHTLETKAATHLALLYKVKQPLYLGASKLVLEKRFQHLFTKSQKDRFKSLSTTLEKASRAIKNQKLLQQIETQPNKPLSKENQQLLKSYLQTSRQIQTHFLRTLVALNPGGVEGPFERAIKKLPSFPQLVLQEAPLRQQFNNTHLELQRAIGTYERHHGKKYNRLFELQQ